MKKFIAICFALIALFAFSYGVAKADVSPQKHESGIVCDIGLAKADLSQSFAEVISPFVFDLYGNEVLYSLPIEKLNNDAENFKNSLLVSYNWNYIKCAYCPLNEGKPINIKSSVWKPDNWQLRYAYCSRNADIDLPKNYQHKPYFRHYKNYGNRNVHRCSLR